MATFDARSSNSAFTSSSLNLGALVDADITVATSTLIRFFFPSTGTGNNFHGTNFSFDFATGRVTGGTVTSIDYFSGGQVQYTLSGLSIPALQVQNFILSGDDSGFLAAVLGGDDTILGSAFADFSGLSALGGNDLIVGGGGADTINGGAGTDTASYATSPSAVMASLVSGTGSGGDATGDTYSSIENLIGSAFGDTLIGDSGANLLAGGGGNDRLIGGAGGDTLAGGAGIDTANYTTAGSAVIVNLAAGHGTAGDAAGDSFSSIENLTGSNFGDLLIGSNGANVLFGVGGDDTISGLGGNDTINGGAGNDTLIGGAGADNLFGTSGIDTASYATAGAPVDVRLIAGQGFAGDAAGDHLATIENLTGSAFGDLLFGDNGVNVLIGGGGNDRLSGFGSNDTINGGAGNDILTGGAGADALVGGAGIDTASYAGATARVDARLFSGHGIAGEANGDTFSGIENLIGSGFGDRLDGTGGANSLSGGNGNDVISGLAGNDVLTGGGGADLLTGGAGADLLNGAGGPDIANYSNAAGPVDARLSVGRGFKGDAQGDRYLSIENVGGSNFADLLVGDNARNILAGHAGNDVLQGLGGDDVLKGDIGNDSIVGGTGDDLLAGGTGNDLFVFRTGDGADTITDFAAGAGPGDRIFFDNGGTMPNSFAEVQTAATQVGADTVINLGGGDTITLLGVTPGDLAADDFLF